MKPFLTARWIDLAMLNYEVDPDALRPRVPAGTELDLRDGRTFVSVVAFRFRDTRVLGVPVPFHRDFEEINLRFYVRRKAPDGWRRGVVFIREVVPRRAVSLVARTLYDEPYVTHPTGSKVELPTTARGSGVAEYRWSADGERLGVSVEVEGEPALPPADSPEAFIAAHHWGYTRRRDGGTSEYRVDHPRWRVWSDGTGTLLGEVGSFYGEPFVQPLAGAPYTCFVAEGSQVQVHRGERLT